MIGEVTIQVISGGENQHCDRFPVLSLHNGKFKGDKFWIHDKLMLHEGIEYKLYNSEEETKVCINCENNFPKSTPFIKTAFCIRCYEIVNHVDRDYYREMLRKELIAEMKAVSTDITAEEVVRLRLSKRNAHNWLTKMDVPELMELSGTDQCRAKARAEILEKEIVELRKAVDPIGLLIWAEENDWTLIQAPGGKHEGNFQKNGKYYASGEELLQMYKESRPWSEEF